MFKPSRLGHVVIRVRDLERSEQFYTRVLGLEVSHRAGDVMVFLRSNPEVDHDLAILKIGDDAPPPEADRVGLYHIAYELASMDHLKEAYRVVREHGVAVAGFGDHPEAKGLYILDPDGIEIELYVPGQDYADTPLEEILSEAVAQ